MLAAQTMYFVDTYKSCIWEFRTDDQGVPVKNGSGAYEKREVVKVPQEEGIPDGMTIDRQVIPSHFALLRAAEGQPKVHRPINSGCSGLLAGHWLHMIPCRAPQAI